VGVVDAGVDDADLDARTGEPQRALRHVGADHADGAEQVGREAGLTLGELDRGHGVHRGDAGQRGQGRQVGRVHLDRKTVPQLAEGVALGVLQPGLLRRRPERLLLPLDLRQRAAVGDGGAGQLDEPEIGRVDARRVHRRQLRHVGHVRLARRGGPLVHLRLHGERCDEHQRRDGDHNQ
jgi:hypothetical protein